MKDIVILGGGGFAREVWWVLEDMNSASPQWNILGFIDESPETQAKELCGLPVLGGFEWFEKGHRPWVLCGVGANSVRRKFASKAEGFNLQFATAIHPAARLSRFVRLGRGTVVCAGTILTTQIAVGEHVNLNLNCTVGHDATIGNFCNISPGVHISGHVQIDEGVDIGTGVALIPSVRVGHDSVIGAGAVVNKDIPPLSVAVGVPAKVIKTLGSIGAAS
jgi:sugar O-acyltransferase (sialic acid O-acetyltransferase NeuD family)